MTKVLILSSRHFSFDSMNILAVTVKFQNQGPRVPVRSWHIIIMIWDSVTSNLCIRKQTFQNKLYSKLLLKTPKVSGSKEI